MEKPPQQNPEKRHQPVSADSPHEEPSTINEDTSDDAPIVAWVVDETPDRVGSPFATAPSGRTLRQQPAIALQDLGPFQYTAMGGTVAAIMLLGFAILALVWFPPGGCIVAALGCGTAILGLHSKFKRITTGVLVSHACLFVACFITSNS